MNEILRSLKISKGGGYICGQKNIISKLFNTVIKKLGDSVFVDFEKHSMVKNHKLIIVKYIVSLYA